MGGGFVVTDYHQNQVVFRVDGCGILGARDNLVLKDGHGDALLLIRRKERCRGSTKLLFTLKDPKLLHGRSNAIRISAQPRTGNCSRDFATRGDFSKKDCRIVDEGGKIIGQIWMNHESEKGRFSNDFYQVTIKPGVHQAFVIGVIAILDYIYRKSTSCISK